jgi:hypothetical protein
MTSAIALEWITVAVIAVAAFAGGWFFRGRRGQR